MNEEKNDNAEENNQDNSLDKKMIDKAKDIGRKQAKMVGKAVKAVVGKAMVILGGLLIKLLPLLVITALLYTAINWIIEIFKSDNTAATIYESLEIESLADLIEIKGDEEKGYYLDFSEDTDKKLEETVEKLRDRSGVQSLKDVEILKKMIKAEVSSQFPNLGGEIAEGSDGFQGGIKVRRVTPNKELGEMKNIGSGEVTSTEKLGTTVNETQTKEDGKIYTVGVMAAYSTDNPGGRSPTEEEEVELKSEEMTILVSRYVQKLLSIYDNIKVVELGSTIENPNVPDAGRLQAAVDANVDILINIDFATSGDGKKLDSYNGVTILYNEKGKTESGVQIDKGSSNESHKLGEILREKVANKININNDKSNYEEPQETIGTSDNKFPSVTIRGGYLTGNRDYQVLSEKESLIDYARGLTDGILEYFAILNKGYGSVTLSEKTITDTVNSKVYDLKYVPEDKFNEYIENNDKDALKVYTLSEDKTKLLTAKWKAEGRAVTIEKNTAMDYRKSMEKYTMPYEYLIAMLIDTKSESFVEGLADMAIKSEYIIAVQDKVTTRETTIETYESKDGGQDVMVSQDGPNLIESVSSSLGLTYADAWFVKFYYDASFSTEYLNTLLTDAQVDRNNLIDIKVDLPGKVTETSPDPTWTQVGTRNETEYLDNGTVRHYTIVISSATRMHSISNTYSTGTKHTEGKEYDFIKLFKNDKEAKARIKSTWLFSILARNEKTKNMVDLTKYLLYKASGVSYGVKTFDFSAYDPTAFKSTSVKGSGVGFEWIKSNENDALRMYINGTYDYYQTNMYINECITEDKTKYIMHDDIGTGYGNKNYGFGVCFYANSSGYGWINQEYFAEHNIDITAPEYNVYGQSMIDVEIVDAIAYKIYQEKLTTVREAASARGVTLEEHQVVCLADFLYQGYGISGVLDAYSQYGLNEGQLRGFGGFQYGQRGDRRWKLFSEGVYETQNGETLDPAQYAGSGSGSSYASEGDGYSQLFTNSHGRTFKEYKQYAGSYANLNTYWGGSVASEGCMITTVAILASGYGVDMTPADTNEEFKVTPGPSVSKLMRNCLPAEISTSFEYSQYVDIETLRNHLLNGGTAYYYATGGRFTSSTHFMAILDISADGSQIYLSNPGAGDTSPLNGWMDLNDGIYNDGASSREFYLIGP